MLGDRTLNQLLREIEQLGGDKVGTALLQFLWLQRLPDSGSLDTLTITADKIHEVDVQPMVVGVSGDNSSQVTQLQQMVSALASAVDALRSGSKTRSRSRFAPPKWAIG